MTRLPGKKKRSEAGADEIQRASAAMGGARAAQKNLLAALRQQGQQIQSLEHRNRQLLAEAEVLGSKLDDLRTVLVSLLDVQTASSGGSIDPIHFTLRQGLRNLAMRTMDELARAILRGGRRPRVAPAGEPEQLAGLVRELMSACLRPSGVSCRATVAAVVQGTDESTPEPELIGRMNDAVRVADEFLRDVEARSDVEFDFDHPRTLPDRERADLWVGSSQHRPVTFVVVPAYLVDGVVVGKALVFTR